MFFSVDETLAREYGWLPYHSDGLYWADIARYLDTASRRAEVQRREKLAEYLVLLNIVHTSEPGRLFEQLSREIEPDSSTADDIGDMQKLKRLKSSRKGGG